MSIGSGNRGTWGKGTAVFLAVLLGILFLRDLPSRLTVLAARQPLFFFLSKEEERGLAGNGILRQASGIGTLSSFIEEQDAIQTRAEADPAYRAWRSEAGSGVLLSAQAEGAGAGNGPAGEQAQETAGAGQTEGGTPSDGGTSPEGGLPAGEEAGGTGAPADPGQPAMAASEVRGTVYTQEQLADFEFVKKNFFYVHKSTTVYPEQLDASVLLGEDMTLPESGEPQILLFHTHGSEALSDSEKGNPDMTVVGLGNYLAKLLSEQYGIQVIHNTEVFPYSDSYSLALDMVEQTLAEHPSIQVTIDLHRDSGGHEVVDVNGKPTAPIMLFNGMCQTPDGPLEDVENPYLLDNLAFNFQMKLKGEAYYPGLMLRTFLKAYRYNQHVLPRATLIEVGTENNTFEEARNAMEPLADILYKVLRGK